MTNDIEPRPWEELRRLIQGGATDQLGKFLEDLSGGDVARSLSRLSSEEQMQLLAMLHPADAAEMFEDIPVAQAVEMVEQLPAPDAATIIAEMSSNEQADLIGAIEEENAEAILSAMDPQEALEVRALVRYPPDVAGGVMVTEYLKYADTSRVRDVIQDLQLQAEQYADYDIQYAYIVDGNERLVGVLRLRDLLLSPPERRVSSLMIRDPLSVMDIATLDEMADFFEGQTFLGVPVVDSAGTLLGVVRRHDVEEAIGDRADNDYLKSQGIIGGEELRSMPLLRRSGRRLSWLTVNVFLNIIAASMIALYQDTLASVIALAVFLPIISDMSGCSGNQAVAVSIRELTLGLVKPYEVFRVWSKEITVGAINGIVLGALVAGAALLWKGNPYLGLVVGVALCVNTMVAVSIGGTVPLILKRFNVDPALASGPVLTTLTDLCGFFLALSLATVLLPWLT